MSDKETDSTNSSDGKISAKGMFFQLQLVVIVALVLATLFTALTPGESSPQGVAVLENPVIEDLPTPTPTIVNTLPAERTNPVIGIVSGHWGNDSGAVCVDGLTEAEVNQTIATLVQKYLSELGFEVDLLREFDPNLTDYRAAALVSIHADSCDYINDQATGFKVATALARSNRESSTLLAACIRNRYASATGLPMHTTSLTPDMTSYHAFNEIHLDTPAAIIETGFLNLDRQFLTGSPELAARGIVNGVLCFINNEEISPNPTSTPE
jgi:N-acetylmuramoyl-L-alanine amidase